MTSSSLVLTWASLAASCEATQSYQLTHYDYGMETIDRKCIKSQTYLLLITEEFAGTDVVTV